MLTRQYFFVNRMYAMLNKWSCDRKWAGLTGRVNDRWPRKGSFDRKFYLFIEFQSGGQFQVPVSVNRTTLWLKKPQTSSAYGHHDLIDNMHLIATTCVTRSVPFLSENCFFCIQMKLVVIELAYMRD